MTQWLLDRASQAGHRQAAARASLVSGSSGRGGTVRGLLLGFEDMPTSDGEQVTTTTVRRAHVSVAGAAVWVTAAPGGYVVGGTVTVQVDGTRRPLHVLGPLSQVPATDSGGEAPAGAGEVVTHMPALIDPATRALANDALTRLAGTFVTSQDEPTPADGEGRPVPAYWTQTNAEGERVARWRWDGTAWVSEPLGAAMVVTEAVIDSLITNTVFTSSLVLASEVDGWVTTVGGNGLRVATPDDDLIAVELGNFARLGMTLYDGGEARSFIGNDGQLGGDVVSANQELWYRGTELSEVLDGATSGLLTRMSFTGTLLDSIPATGGFLDVCEIQFEMVRGRAYRIGTTPVNCLVGSHSGDPAVAAQLFWTTDGTRPGRGSERLFSDHQTPSGPGRVTFRPERIAHVGSTVTARVLLSIASSARGLSVQETATLYVEDLGIDSGPTDGTLRNYVRANEADTPPPTPTPKTKRTPINNGASWVKSWQENGSSPGAIAGKALQGRTPHFSSAGRYESMVGFPSMTGPLSGADIDKVEVYVKPAHGGGSGGNMTVSVGVHGASSEPGSFSRVTSHGLVTKTIKAGRGEWITLPASTYPGFKNGDLRGVAFYTTSESASYYGYMYASGVRVRVHYRK